MSLHFSLPFSRLGSILPMLCLYKNTLHGFSSLNFFSPFAFVCTGCFLSSDIHPQKPSTPSFSDRRPPKRRVSVSFAVFNFLLYQGWSLCPLESCNGVCKVAREVLSYGDGGRQDKAAAAADGTAVIIAPLLAQDSIQIAFHICGCTSATTAAPAWTHNSDCTC